MIADCTWIFNFAVNPFWHRRTEMFVSVFKFCLKFFGLFEMEISLNYARLIPGRINLSEIISFTRTLLYRYLEDFSFIKLFYQVVWFIPP